MEEVTLTTTEQSDTPKEEILVPVYGLPGYRFLLIHVTALVSLIISLLVSSRVLLFLNWPIKSFYSRPIGDRLVVYLALCDLLFSISHIMDHSFMVAIRGKQLTYTVSFSRTRHMCVCVCAHETNSTWFPKQFEFVQ